MSIGKRIKELREKHGYSQERLGDMIGKTRSAISQYESDTIIPRMGVIEALSKVFNVDKAVIIGSPTISDSSFIDVPLYGSIAAGTPLEMLPVNDTYPAPKPIVERYPGGFWLRIASPSMDLLFPVGSLVYVNPMDDIRVNGKPYALCVNGYDATVKLTEKLANGYKLTPASTDPTYKPQIFDYSVPGTDKITVIGEIVYDMKPFDWRY